MAIGLARLTTVHWGALFGVSAHQLYDFGAESDLVLGSSWLAAVLAAATILAVARIALHVWRLRRWAPEWTFSAYLLLVGVLSAGGYALGRCGVIVIQTMRYDLLSVIGAVGLGAWFLTIERQRWIRRAWSGAVIVWALAALAGHGRLWSQYLSHPPIGDKPLIARYLEAKGIKYASSDYWIAYQVTFLTNERIIVASNDFVRIDEYQSIVAAHRAESVVISRYRCGDGQQVFDGVWFCPP